MVIVGFTVQEILDVTLPGQPCGVSILEVASWQRRGLLIHQSLQVKGGGFIAQEAVKLLQVT